jgi:hypothetical protein
MSRLFLATEQSLNWRVVIKPLPPEYAEDASGDDAARLMRRGDGATVTSVRGSGTARLRLRFLNELTKARRTVPTRPGAVVHERVRVQPHNYISGDSGRTIEARRKLSSSPKHKLRVRALCLPLNVQPMNGDDRMQLEAIRGHAALGV